MTPPTTFQTAQSLASDLAEDEMRVRIADMFIEDSRIKAAAIRARSEAQTAWFGNSTTPEDEYHFTQSAIYGAVYQLLEGYKGWRLVRQEGDKL